MVVVIAGRRDRSGATDGVKDLRGEALVTRSAVETPGAAVLLRTAAYAPPAARPPPGKESDPLQLTGCVSRHSMSADTQAASGGTDIKGTRNAIDYVRVSTAGQAADGVSLEAQRARITAAAAAAGLELVAIHADEGLSGKRADNRPGLVAALEAACRAKAVLVVYSLSRMSRSVTDTLAIVGRLDKAGAGFVSLTESIDTTTAAGRMMVTMLAAFAAFERELTAERTATALHHKRSRG